MYITNTLSPSRRLQISTRRIPSAASTSPRKQQTDEETRLMINPSAGSAAILCMGGLDVIRKESAYWVLEEPKGPKGDLAITKEETLPSGELDVVRKEAWPFYGTSSGVRLCWELEEPKGPKGSTRK